MLCFKSIKSNLAVGKSLCQTLDGYSHVLCLPDAFVDCCRCSHSQLLPKIQLTALNSSQLTALVCSPLGGRLWTSWTRDRLHRRKEQEESCYSIFLR